LLYVTPDLIVKVSTFCTYLNSPHSSHQRQPIRVNNCDNIVVVCLLHVRAESSKLVQSQESAREICGSTKYTVTGHSPGTSGFLSRYVSGISPTFQLHNFRKRTNFHQPVIFWKSASIVETWDGCSTRAFRMFV